MVPENEEGAEEGEDGEYPPLEISPEDRSFEEGWKVVSVSYVPPEVVDRLDELTEYDLDKWEVATWAFLRLLEKPVDEVAEEVNEWVFEMKSKFVQAKKQKGEGGGE